MVWPDGTVRWLQGAGEATLDASGEVTGTIGAVRDVTEQMAADEERERLTVDALDAAEEERLSRERLEFLGAINDVLADATDRADVAMRERPGRGAGSWATGARIFVLPAGFRRARDRGRPRRPRHGGLARQLHAEFPYDPDGADRRCPA